MIIYDYDDKKKFSIAIFLNLHHKIFSISKSLLYTIF